MKMFAKYMVAIVLQLGLGILGLFSLRFRAEWDAGLTRWLFHRSLVLTDDSAPWWARVGFHPLIRSGEGVVTWSRLPTGRFNWRVGGVSGNVDIKPGRKEWYAEWSRSELRGAGEPLSESARWTLRGSRAGYNLLRLVDDAYSSSNPHVSSGAAVEQPEPMAMAMH